MVENMRPFIVLQNQLLLLFLAKANSHYVRINSQMNYQYYDPKAEPLHLTLQGKARAPISINYFTGKQHYYNHKIYKETIIYFTNSPISNILSPWPHITLISFISLVN